MDSACSNQFWEITWVILKYPFLKQADFGQKRVDNLRIIRTLAVGYKREFSRRFESSPAEGHRSPAPAAGFHCTDQRCGH